MTNQKTYRVVLVLLQPDQPEICGTVRAEGRAPAYILHEGEMFQRTNVIHARGLVYRRSNPVLKKFHAASASAFTPGAPPAPEDAPEEEQVPAPAPAIVGASEEDLRVLRMLAEAETFTVQGIEVRVPPLLRQALGPQPRITPEQGRTLREAVDALEHASQLLDAEIDLDEEDSEDAADRVCAARRVLAELGLPRRLGFTSGGDRVFVEVGDGPVADAAQKALGYLGLDPQSSWVLMNQEGGQIHPARGAAEQGLDPDATVFFAPGETGPDSPE